MGMLARQGLGTGCRHGQLGDRTQLTYRLESVYTRRPQAALQMLGPCRARLAMWTTWLWWAMESPPGTLSHRMTLLSHQAMPGAGCVGTMAGLP